MKLLIDADIVLFKAAAAVEKEVEFEPDVWVLWTDVSEAIQAFTDSLANLLELADTYSYLLAFSDTVNFRKQIYPEYKANRTQRKPMAFKTIRERVFEEYAHKIVTLPGLEADDVLGITATASPGETMIWSEDKDLRQIPGLHLTAEGQKVIYPDEADRWFYTQVLIGDTADNYKGCPGVGPVKAERCLEHAQPHEMWDCVVDQYIKAHLTEEDALVQARLARILRSDDWNSETKEVKLWQPITA